MTPTLPMFLQHLTAGTDPKQDPKQFAFMIRRRKLLSGDLPIPLLSKKKRITYVPASIIRKELPRQTRENLPIPSLLISCKHHTEGTAPTNPREPADSQSSNPSTSCSTLLEMTSKGSSDSKCFVSKKERLTRIQIEDLILVVYVDDYIVLSPRK